MMLQRRGFGCGAGLDAGTGKAFATIYTREKDRLSRYVVLAWPMLGARRRHTDPPPCREHDSGRASRPAHREADGRSFRRRCGRDRGVRHREIRCAPERETGFPEAIKRRFRGWLLAYFFIFVKDTRGTNMTSGHITISF